jgi:hypothetical protein
MMADIHNMEFTESSPSAAGIITSFNSNSFLSLNKSISCDSINHHNNVGNKDWSLLDSVSMYRSNSSSTVTLPPSLLPPTLASLPSPSTPRLSKSFSSSSIGSCDSDGGGDEIGPHISIFDDYGECDCNNNTGTNTSPQCNHNKCHDSNEGGKDNRYALYPGGGGGTREMEVDKLTIKFYANGERAEVLTPRSSSSSLTCSSDIIMRDTSNNSECGSSAKIFQCEGNCLAGGDDVVLFSVEGVTKLKGGSLTRLVQRLTCDKHNDPEYTSSFLLTHRYLACPPSLFPSPSIYPPRPLIKVEI